MFFQDLMTRGFLDATIIGVDRMEINKVIDKLIHKYQNSSDINYDSIIQEFNVKTNFCNYNDLKNKKKENLIKELERIKDEKLVNNEVIYVLKLSCGKYYVGKTKYLKSRIERHKNGNGSEFTKKFGNGQIELVEVFPNTDIHLENNTVKNYMIKYGINNVRGGSYSNITLSKSDFDSLNRECIHDTNKCYKCGKSGHYANECGRYNLENTVYETLQHFNNGKSISQISQLRCLDESIIHKHLCECIRHKIFIDFKRINFSTSKRIEINKTMNDLKICENELSEENISRVKNACKLNITIEDINYTIALNS